MFLPLVLASRIGAVIRLLADAADFSSHGLHQAMLVANMAGQITSTISGDESQLQGVLSERM
jgi:hypothetical protein